MHKHKPSKPNKIYKKFIILILLTIVISTIGCLNKEEVQVNEIKSNGLSIKLPFNNFPKKYTCKGEDISPPIIIKGVSKKAVSLAIIMEDVDAPSGHFIHWVIWNIPANVSYIPPKIPAKPTISKPFKAFQGINDFGKIGYGGPCPPYGVHRYVLNVYSLNCKLSIPPGSNANTLIRAMKGHVLQHAVFIAKFGS